MHEGRVLKVLIKEKGYIQKDFGKALNVSRMYIAQMVTKEVLPDTFIKKLNDFLKIDFRKQAKEFAESKNIVEAFVNIDHAKKNLPSEDETTRSQVQQLNNYIMELQRTIIDLQQQVMQLQALQPKSKKPITSKQS